MIEQGIIISQNNEFASIQMLRGEQCKDCKVCDMGNDGRRTIEAINAIGAQIGDEVEVEIKASNLLKFSFLVFIFPILLIIIGYYVGMTLLGNKDGGEGYGVLGAAIGFVLSFVIIKKSDKKWGKDSRSYAQITGLIQSL